MPLWPLPLCFSPSARLPSTRSFSLPRCPSVQIKQNRLTNERGEDNAAAAAVAATTADADARVVRVRCAGDGELRVVGNLNLTLAALDNIDRKYRRDNSGNWAKVTKLREDGGLAQVPARARPRLSRCMDEGLIELASSWT